MKIAFLAVLVAASQTLAADPIWTPVDKAPEVFENLPPGPRPTKGQLVAVDDEALRKALAQAPAEDLNRHLRNYGSVITLPMPDGTTARFHLANSPIMEPELAARFPHMQTFIVHGIDDPTASGRLDYTQRGFRGMLRTTEGALFIDAYSPRDPSLLVSYFLRDLPNENDWTCHTREGVHGLPGPDHDYEGGFGERVLTVLRTYRIAMACTGEFGLHQCTVLGNPPNAEDPLAAIVTIVNRTNVVYEVDVGVRYVLVANNHLIIFFDPDTDPYSTSCDGQGGADCSGEYLSQNPPVINGAIGSANYDVGHLMTRVYGGVANLSSVCTSNKARGISGIPRGGDVDPLTALVAIHELGHQTSAPHTFNGALGRCANNASGNSAWEPGSGSTPMAYAGGCPVGDGPPTDNIVQFAEPWFHSGSYNSIRNFVTGTTGNSCAVRTTTTNNAPTIVQLPPGTSNIPPNTPFALTALGADQDDDVLLYSWEQVDVGPQRALSEPDNGTSPLFRVFQPTTSGTRVFPRWADILSGVPTPGERLPTVQPSTRKFRVYIRDNRMGGGGAVRSTIVNVALPEGFSEFAVTGPAEGANLRWGPADVTWTVGNTTASPVSVANVRITMSTDGGQTWPIELAASSPNSGSASVSIPTGFVGSARIRVEALGNIFFNVSRPFRIWTECGPADFNSDGQVDFFDYLDFVQAFSNEDPSADINGDGQVDFFDYLDFVAAFDEGC